MQAKRTAAVIIVLMLFLCTLAPVAMAIPSEPQETMEHGGGFGGGGAGTESKLGEVYNVVDSVIELFQIEFTIFGFTISFWQVFLFVIMIGFVSAAISVIYGG